MMRLRRLVAGLPKETQRKLVIQTILGAVSTTVVLIVVTMAAQHVEAGTGNFFLLLGLIAAVLIFASSQNGVMTTCSREVGEYVHEQRVALFQEIRRTTPATLQRIGRAPLYAALTKDSQLIARHLPYLIMALQQAVLLVFVAFYLAYLSVIAFVITTLFSALAIHFHLRRMKALTSDRRQALADERFLFDGMRDMLSGFKEIKMARRQSAAIGNSLANASAQSRDTNAYIQKRWGYQFALIEVIFYVLVGLMVFVAPLFVTDYQEIAIPATTAALFMIGPISTLAMTLPAVDDVEAALAEVDRLKQRLREEAAQAPDESSLSVAVPIRSIALEDLRFHYEERDGTPGFALGPISARFAAGEVTFITGGNGAGKSTLLNLLTGLTKPQSGRILVNGTPLISGQEQAYRDQISAVFYDFHLFRVLYGIEEVAPQRAADLLNRLEMADKVTIKDRAFSTIDLSSGQRKRLALVLAELENKDIVILDEWAADQDPHFRQVFYRDIVPDLKARGKIVICVTHDDRYFAAADHVLRMAEGRLVQSQA